MRKLTVLHGPDAGVDSQNIGNEGPYAADGGASNASSACTREGLCEELPVEVVDKLDLLVVVDDSARMERPQQAFLAQVPALLEALASGKRSPDDAKGFPAVRDLQLGVVATDLLIPGLQQLGTCQGYGDGKLQHRKRSADCEHVEYPSWLTYNAVDGSTEKIARDFSCIAHLGENGCGYEQPLEAALKGLWPSEFRNAAGEVVSPNPIQFLWTNSSGMSGHGDRPTDQGGSAGFVRSDAVLGIIVLSDEDDGSIRDPAPWASIGDTDPSGPYYGQDVNLRGFYNPEALTEVPKRYLTGYQLLHQGHEERVVFAAIAGVPTDLVDSLSRAKVNMRDAAQRDGYYDTILSDERMQEVVDPASNPGMGQGALRPSCSRPAPEGEWTKVAFPPRRLVEVARAFGENGVVQSICQDDLNPVIAPIVDRLANRLGIQCLPAPLARAEDGRVACDVIWELPAARDATMGVPSDCSQLDFLSPAAKSSNERGGKNCLVRQVVATDAEQPSEEGFYYDDFTPSPENQCRDSRSERIRFTPAATPHSGVRVVLDCAPGALQPRAN